MPPKDKLYSILDTVPDTGDYICVPCGYIARFVEGQHFPVCPVCLAGTERGIDGYTKPESEFWQWFDE